MRIVVQKFGGSSLSSAAMRREAMLRVREAVQEGLMPVVVVSAMGRLGDAYATDTLLKLMQETNPAAEGANLDLLLSCGEIISAAIFAEGLSQMGLAAQALTGWQCGITTDDVHQGARVKRVQVGRLLECVDAGIIPIVAGFQGVSEKGAVTTLGRGGSDTTAAVLGVVLKAERVEIFTDVDGIKTADPSLIPDAPTLQALSYREVVEMGHMGAKVLHPRAAEITMEEGIPLQIRSVVQSKGGTTIGRSAKSRAAFAGGEVTDRVVTGIAHLGKRAQVRIEGSDFHRSNLGTQVFHLLAEAGVSVDLIHFSPERIAFVIDQAKVNTARTVLSPLGLHVKIKVGFAKVSVVGAGMHGVPGVMARVVGALEADGIPIYQTTDSHANISCLVLEEHMSRAVRALYKEFQLDRI
ncbi:MAG: aspartate kinase [Bacillota bacterium]|jgi:aspartate kinase|nr:aspartate kinase [Bacillota bacterium]HHT91421.1 aspartate kinase [Bacillota bacterium]